MSQLTVNSQVLKSLLTHTVYAAATDDSRPVLHAVHLRAVSGQDGARLFAEATDGFRLSVANATIEYEEWDSAIVPIEFVKSLIKQIGKYDEPITLTTKRWRDLNPDVEAVESQGMPTVAKPIQISAESAHLSLTSHLIEGTYPDCAKLIPTKHVTEIGVRREALLAAVKRCAIFAKENNDVLKLEINSDQGEYERFLTVSANAAEIGDAVETINEGIFDGDGNVIAFNWRYVHDLLNSYKARDVIFRMQGRNNPGVFLPQTEDGCDVAAVIMPMHLAA
jgi:DNA polymerase-3 subunit beta